MKLIIITSIREDLSVINHIMEKSGIPVFSVSETVGHKTEHQGFLMDNWYGKNEDGTDALFTFSFTNEATARTAMLLIKAHNAETNSQFPIRGFLLPVEETTY